MKLNNFFKLTCISSFLVFLVANCDKVDSLSNSYKTKKPKLSEIEEVKKKAEGGDPLYQFKYANFLSKGANSEKNIKEAYKWYLMAAEKGHDESMVEVAKLLTSDQGIKFDLEKSKLWIERAAFKGNAEAQSNYASTFGFVTKNGAFIFGDLDEAQKNSEKYIGWLTKSASKNFAQAKYKLGMTYLLGAKPWNPYSKNNTTYLITPDKNKGFDLLKAASDLGDWLNSPL